MMTPDFGVLARLLHNPENLILDLTQHDAYLRDATEKRGQPRALVFAETEEDVVAAVNFCNTFHIPIIPRGAGTGLSGGCVPSPGSLVLSTERLKKLRVAVESKTAVCGPGVITKDLKDKAEEFGLTFAPDPASYDECTIGGNAAECAGGLRCRKYGVTKDYVLGMRAITSEGMILNTGVYNENRGFALGDVLVGSEGTLAIITEITVGLIDKPQTGTTILAGFNNARDAAQTVSDITASGVIPSIMEFVDADAVGCSIAYEKAEGLRDGLAALLIETSGANLEQQTRSVISFCKKNNSAVIQIEPDPTKADRLWQIRRNVSKAIKAMARQKISEDIAVPNSRIPALVEFVAEMNRTSSLRINTFGHAGDGNIHVTFMSMTGTPEEMRQIEEGILTVFKKVVELGGTLTGEHGIGLAKQNYLHLEFDEPTLRFMRGIKEVFDPDELINPGKVFVMPTAVT